MVVWLCVLCVWLCVWCGCVVVRVVCVVCVYVCLCIATPLSINAELASEFRLAGLRDICIRVVDSAEISLDLIELSIKV